MTIYAAINRHQEKIYDDLRNIATEQDGTSRVKILSVPATLEDTVLGMVKHPLNALESTARAVYNLAGCLLKHCTNWEWTKTCTLQQVISQMDSALGSIAIIPVKVATAPFKFAYQLFQNLKHPARVMRQFYF